MISIIDKHNCCGCNACVQKCPKQCITMREDEEGFLYPSVNLDICIDCHLCETVCPCLNQEGAKEPIVCLAAKNIDEDIRKHSSSGGIFISIAKKVIQEGGIVFGARFDDRWQVMHDFAETYEDVAAFRGSKYVQSKIRETFKQAEAFLKKGRRVLFSGTPCQILALNRFLRKKYDNLLTIEVVCHGVPSPKVWQSYLQYINPNHKQITAINLRDKSRGWKHYSYLIQTQEENLVDDYAASSLYLRGFSSNMTLRPSCYRCPAKGLSSGADITLADCWGIENLQGYHDDDKGISAVLANTPEAMRLLGQLNFASREIDYAFVTRYNPSIVHSPIEPFYRKFFWRCFPQHGIGAVEVVFQRLKNPLYKLINKLMTFLQK